MTSEQLPKSLGQRSLGVFPLSAVNASESDSLWVQAIGLEYRVHNKFQGDIDLIADGSVSREEIQELMSQASALFARTQENSTENVIVRASYAILLIHATKYDEVVQLLSNFSISVKSNSYLDSLLLKISYLLSIAFKKLGDLTHYKDTIVNTLSSLDKIPELSDVESNYWLNLLFNELFETLESISVSRLNSVFKKNENFTPFFIEYLNSENNFEFTDEFVKEFNIFVQNRSNKLLNLAKFPKSDETNDYNLEEFLQQVSKSSFISNQYKRKLIEDGISKTYQSQILINSLTHVLLSIGISDEIKSSFEVFENYIEAFYLLNNHKYNDILSILSLFKDVLSNKFGIAKKVELSDDEYHYYLKLIQKFKTLLLEFYSNNELIAIDEDYDLFNHLTNKKDVNLSKNLKLLLSSFWSILGVSSFIINLSDHSVYSQNHSNLRNSLIFTKNSIFLNQNETVFFRYILALAVLRKTTKAFKYLKFFLKNLTIKNEIYFKSWHLLSLILSIEENKEESFKVVSFLINEIGEFLNDSAIIQSNLSLSLKQIFIQVKLSQLAIIEALFGIEQTLDTLPELFELYNTLFRDSLETIETERPDRSHKKSISLASVHTLTKIKSIRAHKKESETVLPTSSPTNTAAVTREQPQASTTESAPYQFKQKHSIEQKILQKLWIQSAVIYSNAGLPKEAEQSLLDAENCYQPTSETHTTLGFLTSSTNPKLALSEFEKALTLNRASLETIIGLSNLILNEDNDKVLFIDDKDRVAGIARVKLLLETASENFEGAYSSEVWWLLSLIYERFKDKTRLKESLWRSVELEESRAVRKFSTVEGWY